MTRALDRQLPGRLQIGLLEAGVHAAGVGDLELGVQVLLVVDRVDEAVQTFTCGHVLAVGLNDHDVGRVEVRKLNPGVDEVRRRVEFAPVQRDARDRRGDEIKPRRGASHDAVKRDGRARGVGVAGTAEIELHGVVHIADDARARGGFVAGEILSRHVVHPA